MRFLVGSAALVVIACVVACGSSSSDEEGTTEDQAKAAPAPTPSTPPPATPATPAGDPGKPGGGGGGGTGTGGGDGGGTGTGGDGGGGGGGGGGLNTNPQCAADSVVETEGNDTAEAANVVPNATGTFCGSLATADDVDYVTFVLPKETTEAGFGYAWSQPGLEIQGTVAGETFTVGQKPVVKPGEKYVLKVTTTGKTPVSYRLAIEIKTK